MTKTRPAAPEAAATGPEPRSPQAAARTIEGPAFARKNYVLFGVALAVIALGFVLLSQNDITLAPILLVAGYLVLVPLAILKR